MFIIFRYNVTTLVEQMEEAAYHELMRDQKDLDEFAYQILQNAITAGAVKLPSQEVIFYEALPLEVSSTATPTTQEMEDPDFVEDADLIEDDDPDDEESTKDDDDMLKYWGKKAGCKDITEIFIQIVYETDINALLKDKSTRKKSIWQKVQLILKEKGHPIPSKNAADAAVKAAQKNRNLVKSYKNFIKHVFLATGETYKKPPKYFNLLHPHLAGRHDVVPQYMIDSFDKKWKGSTSSATDVTSTTSTSSSIAGPSSSNITSNSEKRTHTEECRHDLVKKKLKPGKVTQEDVLDYLKEGDKMYAEKKDKELKLLEEQNAQRQQLIDLMRQSQPSTSSAGNEKRQN